MSDGLPDEVLADELVPPDALSAWLGEPIIGDVDKARARSVIAYALDLVNSETGRTNQYWDVEGLPSVVRNVVLAVAAYGYSNPEWWGNERVDDWGGGARPIQEIGMYLTATQKNMLRPYAKRALFGIGVLDTSKPIDEVPAEPWFDRQTGGIPDWRFQ